MFDIWKTRTAMLLAVPCVLMAAVNTSAGDDPIPFSPREALGLVEDAALAWEPDARLVYLENDEALTGAGESKRWGYLFYSPTTDQARGYSVRSGKIVAASDLQFEFDAPPLPGIWIDADVALAAAEKKAGARYREEFGGEVTTLLLVRGGFDEKKPDITTWTVIYTSPAAPSLFVLVDAVEGKVKKTWRG